MLQGTQIAAQCFYRYLHNYAWARFYHKVWTFEAQNKHLVLVLQDKFLDYMKREFRFGHLSVARDSDPMHLHAYSLSKNTSGHSIALAERYSTDTEGVAICLSPQAETNVELSEIVAAIESKMTESTLLEARTATVGLCCGSLGD